MKTACLSNNELKTFCDQLALILRSGISVLEGISIMEEDAVSAEGKSILNSVNQHFSETGCLYDAFREAGVFPEYMIHMTEIGERTGRLDEVMTSLSIHYERQDNLMKNIKSAVTYPLVMLGMMLVVVLVLVMKVMPVFEQVFKQLGAEMTGFSASVLTLGNLLGRYAAVFAVVIILLVIFILYLSRTANGRRQFASFLQTFPATKALSEKIACSRFADGMALMLGSGLDTDESLELMEQSTEHPALKDKIAKSRAQIAEGSDFASALNENGIFSGVYSRMVSVGFRTGAVDEVMKKISDRYEEEINDRIQNLVSVLEPTMVAFLSIIVGLILLSVMLPLTGIMSSIG